MSTPTVQNDIAQFARAITPKAKKPRLRWRPEEVMALVQYITAREPASNWSGSELVHAVRRAQQDQVIKDVVRARHVRSTACVERVKRKIMEIQGFASEAEVSKSLTSEKPPEISFIPNTTLKDVMMDRWKTSTLEEKIEALRSLHEQLYFDFRLEGERLSAQQEQVATVQEQVDKINVSVAVSVTSPPSSPGIPPLAIKSKKVVRIVVRHSVFNSSLAKLQNTFRKVVDFDYLFSDDTKHITEFHINKRIQEIWIDQTTVSPSTISSVKKAAAIANTKVELYRSHGQMTAQAHWRFAELVQ